MWGTSYNGGLYDKADKPALKEYNYQKHYLMLEAEHTVTFTMEFFGWWSVRQTLTSELFKLHPLEFWMIWYRPSNDYSTAIDNFDLKIYFSSFFQMLNFYVTNQEQFKVCQKSVVDWAQDSANN